MMNSDKFHERVREFRSARSHGQSIAQAARKADISIDRAHKLEGRSYCSQCGDFVSDDDCVHWDYESGESEP